MRGSMKIELKRWIFKAGYRLVFLLILLNFSDIFSQEKLENGFTQFFYGNGQVSSEGWIQDGKPNGNWTTYWVNGKIKSVGLRRNFQLDSVWSFYDENANLTEQINYRYGQKNGYYLRFKPVQVRDTFQLLPISKELYLDNKKQGLSYYYDNQGYVKQVIRFKDGKKHGIMRELGPDTLIQVVFRYHNDFLIDREFINQKDRQGLRQGVWRDYYDNDNIRFEANYKDDQLNGYYREYGSTGKLLVSIFYEKGLVVDKDPETEISVEVRTQYDDDGRLISSGGYMNNIPVGTHRNFSKGENAVEIKEYSNSGQIVSSGQTDKQGLRGEFWQFFYPVGQVRSEGYFKDDRRSGEWKFYYPSGVLEQTGSYLNGREEGVWTWYYQNGSVLREENYYRGREDGLSVEYGEDGQEVVRGEYLDGL